MRTYWIAHETLFNDLWWLKWEENSLSLYIYVYNIEVYEWMIHFVVQVETNNIIKQL